MTSNGINGTHSDVRTDMSKFWKEHSKEATSKEMMLDDKADEMGEREIPEVLSLLPDIKGKDVLELGAGIGRFTGHLAEIGAKSIIALDFIEKFIKKNEETHGHHKNIIFECQDVTTYELAPKSVDVIFSNWLFMYLDDDETRTVFTKMLSWLRDDGYFFFRESCFYKSGNKSRTFNPTKYRDPGHYMDLVSSVSLQENGGKETSTCIFDIICSRSIQTYIQIKQNRNQICWLFHKVRLVTNGNNQGFKTFQEFLDNKQYSQTGILRYERIFGKHFVSTGGLETTKEFVDMLDLQAGQAVLDIGCGIGGSAFYMAEKFDVNVTGMDLSTNMINIALERANEIGDNRVQFEVADATKREYAPQSVDVVYSRDTILHIKDKLQLFKAFFTWMKPGGKVLISDYCCSEGEHTDTFKKYVAQRGYILLSVPDYGKVLEEAGFICVRAEDRTSQFKQVLDRELVRTETIKDDFIKDFSEKDYLDIVNGWQDKLKRVGKQGNQRWGLFYAEKPNE